ncbi:MAG: rhodanese-like domain-containing protein [Prevotella sp.]
MKKIITTIMAAIGLCMSCQADDGIQILSPDEYESAVKSDTTSVILDVRTPSEYEDGHIDGAVLLDFLNADAFSEGIDKLDKSKTYYIYCRSGRRSHNAALKMKDKGYNVYDMRGGIIAWTAAGKNTVKAEKPINESK